MCIDDPKNVTSINKGIALRPVANIDNDLIYSNGDVINQEEENLTLIRES